MNKKSLLISLMLACSTIFAEPQREIAITIDDLPFVGSANNDPKKLQREHDRFMLMLQALVDRKVPATGFVIAGSIEKGQWQLLEAFRDAGMELGNHTYSHKSLNSLTAEKYIADLEHADKLLDPIMTKPKYFRYPYLAESKGVKREEVHTFLTEHGYTIAPVTIDSKDFKFNSQLFAIPYRLRPQNLNQLKKRYLAYMWNQTLRAEANAKQRGDDPIRQVLLIHANLLNSHFLGDVIDMYQANGYRIVSLDEILKKTKGSNEPAAIELSPVLDQILN